MKYFGLTLLAVIFAAAIAAPIVAPYPVDRQFRGLLNAPPTMPHIRDDAGAWHAPFIYPWTLTNQLEQRYEQDRTTRVSLRWLGDGHIVSSSDDQRMPLLLLGADSYGRDVSAGARVEPRDAARGRRAGLQ